MIKILVKFEVEIRSFEICKELFNKLQKESEQEEGCIAYQVYQNANKLNEFILCEAFEDKEAQEFHKTTKHYLEILKGELEKYILDKEVKFLI